MAEETTKGRWNKNIKGLVEAIDFLLIPTSVFRHVRNLDKRGELESPVSPYFWALAGEAMRLGIYYKVVVERLLPNQ